MSIHVCKSSAAVFAVRERVRVAKGAARATMSNTEVAPPRKVLLTNDDGPRSPFFEPFVRHVAQTMKWECVVCIPNTEFSFCSKMINKGPVKCIEIKDTPLQRELQQTSDGGQMPRLGPIYHMNASPGTCVNIAIHSLALDCDLVLSGPNVGHNAGRSSILSSGTVGAALEGAICGKKAIAISYPFFSGWNNWTDEQILDAVNVTGDVIHDLWNSWSTETSESKNDLFYNVNVPLSIKNEHSSEANLRLVRRTFVDTATDYTSLFQETEDTELPTEAKQYTWGPKGLRSFESVAINEGSDVWAVRNKLVSVTPLKANLKIG